MENSPPEEWLRDLVATGRAYTRVTSDGVVEHLTADEFEKGRVATTPAKGEWIMRAPVKLWMPHNGGPCPVAADSLPDVLLADGTEENMEEASMFRWKWDEPHPLNVVAYREERSHSEMAESIEDLLAKIAGDGPLIKMARAHVKLMREATEKLERDKAAREKKR